jgi:hypothetical protein
MIRRKTAWGHKSNELISASIISLEAGTADTKLITDSLITDY